MLFSATCEWAGWESWDDAAVSLKFKINEYYFETPQIEAGNYYLK